MKQRSFSKAIIYIVISILVLSVYGKEPVLFKTEQFTLRFSADGYPKSFKLLSENKELLKVSSPGLGFYLAIPGHEKTYTLSDLSFDPQTGVLTAKPEIKGKSLWTPKLQFEVKQQSSYLAFHLKKVEGIPDNSNISLNFAMNSKDRNLRVFDFNYMTETKSSRGVYSVSWPCLWQYEKKYGYGGFALFYRNSDDEEDDTILHIWGNEGLPHPKVKGRWNYERAKAWVEAFYKRYRGHARYGGHYGLFAAEAKSLKELYELADYAEKGGFPGAYLMPWVWRGEYWPRKCTTVQINKKIFPNGEKDFKKYSDYLWEKGLNLELHYVSGGIGFSDKKYVSGDNGIDQRLASWGNGTLAGDIGKDDEIIYFKPAPGTQRPAMLYHPGITRMPLLDNNTYYDKICIGREMIEVGAFENTDQPVWKLSGCKRGYKSDVKLSHKAGTAIRGLISPYHQILIADCYKSLFTEIAVAYAEFLNRNNIGHAAFDGLEIYDYGGFQQGEKFTEVVYRNLDHPTMAHTSGGRQPKCWLSTRLNRRKQEWGDGEGNYAILLTDTPSRIATNARHANFMLSQAAAHGVSGMGFGAHDRGITVEELKKHGKTEEILQATKEWRRVVPYLTEQQKKEILAPEYVGRHPYSKIYHEIKKTDGGWNIYPVGFMEQDKYDGYWNTAQEHGAMAPKQFIKPNQKLSLNNRFAAQVPELVIRVMWATDYNSQDNINIMPEGKAVKNPTDTKLTIGSNSIQMKHSHRLHRKYYNMSLPYWRKKVNMLHARSIGMWIEGDGSDALLVLSPGKKRYYAIPLDFKGKRYVEIPHGEVYWAQRMLADKEDSGLLSCSKFFKYDKVRDIKLGLAKIPEAHNVDIKVSGIKVLKEIPSELVNPIINIGNGRLKIHGIVKTGHYIEYLGGDTATVYDANWNKTANLKVTSESFKAEHGKQTVEISAENVKKGGPWMELQLFVKGKPIFVKGK